MGGTTSPAGALETTAPERRALVGTMYEAIRHELTGRQRIALLAELKGMPQSEIARQLGSNRNAVYKLTHDAVTHHLTVCAECREEHRALRQALEENDG